MLTGGAAFLTYEANDVWYDVRYTLPKNQVGPGTETRSYGLTFF